MKQKKNCFERNETIIISENYCFFFRFATKSIATWLNRKAFANFFRIISAIILRYVFNGMDEHVVLTAGRINFLNNRMFAIKMSNAIDAISLKHAKKCIFFMQIN